MRNWSTYFRLILQTAHYIVRAAIIILIGRLQCDFFAYYSMRPLNSAQLLLLTITHGSFGTEERDAADYALAPRFVHSLGARLQEILGRHHADQHQVPLRIAGRFAGR